MKKQYGQSHRTVGAAFLSTLIAVAALVLSPLHARAAGECVAGVSGGAQTFALLAGQTIPAGTVSVNVNGTNLEVTFATTGGWELSEAHLWIGNSLDDLPQTKSGNPIPGKFPYNSGSLAAGTASHTFSIPLSNPIVNFSCPAADTIYYMAAHASVRKAKGDGTYQTETGWSEGSPITSKGNWATFSTFSLTCDCGGTGKAICETAFARYAPANTCFNDIGFERWGWTNGPLGSGSYTMDVYAGAGQCDLAKGTHVGTLSVNYNGTAATATFSMFNGFWMEETHLYIGNDRLPKMKQGKNMVETVAPGQYPYIHDDLEGATSDSYSVNSLSGPIHVVGHAVVCHEE